MLNLILSEDSGNRMNFVLKRLVVIMGVAFALATASFAQNSATAKPYTLKPEDVIRIQVFNQQQIAADVPVGEDGNIAAPFVGVLYAEGKTLDEIEKELFALYKKKLLLRDPIVSVTVIQYRRLKASINGQVNRSGEIIFRPGDTIINLLSAGGGYISDRADARRATLRRKNSKELIPVDLYALTVFGDNSQNYELQDGDVLDIPEEQRNRIMVLGQVRSPGLYPYRETMRLMDAVSVSGGEVPYRARTSKAYVMRELPGRPGEYVRINADLVKFLNKGDSMQNVKLLPGDLVYIPATNTPDFQQLNSIVNSIFIFNSLGNLFGFRF
jgi:protein involved in polysaccharide export with SLBB domain